MKKDTKDDALEARSTSQKANETNIGYNRCSIFAFFDESIDVYI